MTCRFTSVVIIIRNPPLIRKPPLFWPILRFGLSENFEMDLSFPFGNHRFWLQTRSKSVQKCSTFSPAAPKSSKMGIPLALKMRFWVCISYINRVKSAPKAPKILGTFWTFNTPPLVMAAFETRGGFIRNTTDIGGVFIAKTMGHSHHRLEGTSLEYIIVRWLVFASEPDCRQLSLIESWQD